MTNNSSQPHYAWLIVLVALSFVWGIWSYPLFDLDEGAFSEASREMLENSEFLITTLDGELRSDKPILIYWLQAASVSLFGELTWAYRFPSVIASLLWLATVWRMAREIADDQVARLAIILFAGCFEISIIAKAAIADALLHLFLTLTAFEIYRYWQSPAIKHIRLTFLWMALGFLTKGPVAVVLPFLVTLVLAVLDKRWLDWRRAIFSLQGWGIFLVVATPWYLAVWLVHGTEFLEGFFLDHNLSRFSKTKEGHGGSVFYYFIALPLVLMPFTGWFLSFLKRAKKCFNKPFERFALIWLVIAMLIFSFSKTQLPHYILYGCTPLLLAMAMNLPEKAPRWVYALPALLLLLFVMIIPALVDIVLPGIDKPYERDLLSQAPVVFDMEYKLTAYALFLFAILVVWKLWHQLKLALLMLALASVAAANLLLLPAVAQLQQVPVQEAAKIARDLSEPVVSYHIGMPSFSVYRQAVTPARFPKVDEVVFTKSNSIEKLTEAFGKENLQTLYAKGGILLIRINGTEEPAK